MVALAAASLGSGGGAVFSLGLGKVVLNDGGSVLTFWGWGFGFTTGLLALGRGCVGCGFAGGTCSKTSSAAGVTTRILIAGCRGGSERRSAEPITAKMTPCSSKLVTRNGAFPVDK